MEPAIGAFSIRDQFIKVSGRSTADLTLIMKFPIDASVEERGMVYRDVTRILLQNLNGEKISDISGFEEYYLRIQPEHETHSERVKRESLLFDLILNRDFKELVTWEEGHLKERTVRNERYRRFVQIQGCPVVESLNEEDYSPLTVTDEELPPQQPLSSRSRRGAVADNEPAIGAVLLHDNMSRINGRTTAELNVVIRMPTDASIEEREIAYADCCRYLLVHYPGRRSREWQDFEIDYYLARPFRERLGSYYNGLKVILERQELGSRRNYGNLSRRSYGNLSEEVEEIEEIERGGGGEVEEIEEIEKGGVEVEVEVEEIEEIEEIEKGGGGGGASSGTRPSTESSCSRRRNKADHKNHHGATSCRRESFGGVTRRRSRADPHRIETSRRERGDNKKRGRDDDNYNRGGWKRGRGGEGGLESRGRGRDDHENEVEEVELKRGRHYGRNRGRGSK